MKKTILLITTIATIGCQNQQSDNEFVTEKWSNGQPKTIELTSTADTSLKFEIQLDSLGRLKELTPFQGQEIEGTKLYFRDNSELGAALNYVDGKRHGYTYEFYSGVQRAFQGLSENGDFNGTSTWYYRNGQIQETGERVDDQKEGKWTEYFENGQLKAKGTYTAGKKNDDWTYWSKTGELKEKNTAGNKK